MIDVWNRVMNNLLTAETGTCACITSDSNITPPKFPALSCEVIGASDTAVDLENSENAITSMVRLRAYSVNGLTEARKTINVACDAMRQMGYVRTFGPEPVPYMNDFNIRVMEARFRRIVNGLDDIPKFETEDDESAQSAG